MSDYDTKLVKGGLTEQRLPDSSVTRMEYGIGAIGDGSVLYHRTLMIDPETNRSVQYRDARDNLVRVERRDAGGVLLTSADYRYNVMGEMIDALDAAGNAVSISYDQLGRKTSLTSPDGGRVEYTYNGQGQLWQESTSELRARGRFISYEYDGYGRNTGIGYPDSENVVYEYGGPEVKDRNLAGRLVRVRDESGEAAYEYGLLGETIRERRQLRQERDRSGTMREAVMSYRSDYLGRMQHITYPDGETVSYGYDAGGNVSQVTGKKDGVTFPYVQDIGYDEWGQRVYIKLGNGVETHYEYNPARRWLKQIQTAKGTATLQHINYTFDRVGNVSGYENTADSYRTMQEYTYDSLYQRKRTGA